MSRKDIDIVCLVYDILIVVLAVPIILISWYMLGGYKTADRYLFRYKYADSSVYKVIDDANDRYIQSFLLGIHDSSTLESPITIQKVLYDYNTSKGIEDSTIFETYKTGYKDFASSEYVISDKSVSTSDCKYWDMISKKTNGAINVKNFKGIDTKDIKLAGVCTFNADTPFHRDSKGTLYYTGYCDYYATEDMSIYGIPIDDEYKLYLIQGTSIKDDLLGKKWQTIEFTQEYKTVMVNPFSISAYSNNSQYLRGITRDGKLRANKTYLANITVSYFDLRGETLKKDSNYDNMSKVDASFSSDFVFVVKNVKSGIIIQVGSNELSDF